MSSLAKAFATKVNACGAFLAEQSGLRAHTSYLAH
jgi:hypothetical protein